MKKCFLWIAGILAIILVLAFVLLFTPLGNGILKPYIQSQLDKKLPFSTKLEVFELGISDFDIEISAMENIVISANGTYSLFSQNIDGVLNIFIKNPSDIKELSAVKLDDNFLIENVIRGKFSNFSVFTKSNLADGRLNIDTQIMNFSPIKILAKIENMKLESLLNIAGQKPYATGIFNLNADIVGDSALNFTGNAKADITKAKLNEELAKQEFNLKLPNKTNFTTTLNISFDGKDAKHTLNFLSQIGNITSTGSTTISDIKTNSTYDVNISDLSPFSTIAGMPLRGSFRTEGKIQGSLKWLNIDGKSDFAQGNTAYSISLENLTKPKDALINIQNLKIEDVLYTIYKPIYAKAHLNAKIDLKQISSNISGSYIHKIQGEAQRSVIKREFDFNPPNNIPFFHNANITLEKGKGEINANIESDLASISIEKGNFILSDLSATVPYKIIISDLKKLAFATSKELKGNIIATGNVKYAPQQLYADLESNIFGGKLTAMLDRNIADIKMLDIKAISVLDMLQYPQFFDSNINGNIRYDIVTQKGIMDFMATNGHFAENMLTSLLKNMLGFDLTSEIYGGIKIDGRLDKKVATASLDATSKNSSITSKNAVIDFERDAINAYLNLKVNNDELGAKITGKVGSPNISLDGKKAVKTILNKVLGEKKVNEIQDKVDSAKEKAQEKVQENINKQVDKVGEQIGNTLKNLFK